ncbi:hypothetical protein [Spirosoma montaniterrae]|uniref:Cytochrome B n=1 Tax=Spirosoma montaniterrae TaxID=1178516 RepID=A0A1P9WVE5_9BACT|nr:hypothetical protein [Spirosoma montaniterrae]AQG79355.1 hypothetical protein AWR27_08505 [Spirosoma montaniterrae]
MYLTLLALHSVIRWFVVIILGLTLAASWQGWLSNRPYTPTDARLRSIATSITHLQLLLGFVLYFKSPITGYFRENFRESLNSSDLTFFGLIHISLMLVAVVVLTFGSSLGKRAATDAQKHRTVALYFLAGTLILLAAVPWPFSPLAQRPLFRSF